MGRIKLFHYKVVDACKNMVLDTILEISPADTKILWVFADGETKETILTGREDEFISAILSCNILSWNGKSYENITENCGSWYLEIIFDDKHIRCSGYGGYPRGFNDFLKMIGYTLAPDKEKYYISSAKHTRIKKLREEEMHVYGSYCDINVDEFMHDYNGEISMMRKGLFIDDLYTPPRMKLTWEEMERIRSHLMELGIL